VRLQRAAAIARATATVTSQAQTFAETINRQILTLDQTLRILVAAWAANPRGFDLNAWHDQAIALDGLSRVPMPLGFAFARATVRARRPSSVFGAMSASPRMGSGERRGDLGLPASKHSKWNVVVRDTDTPEVVCGFAVPVRPALRATAVARGTTI